MSKELYAFDTVNRHEDVNIYSMMIDAEDIKEIMPCGSVRLKDDVSGYDGFDFFTTWEAAKHNQSIVLQSDLEDIQHAISEASTQEPKHPVLKL